MIKVGKIAALVLLFLFIVGCSTEKMIGGVTQINNEQASENEEDGIPDQVDLELGDTGILEDTIGSYQITIHSISFAQELEGKKPSLDYFFSVEVTVENIGSSDLTADEPISVLQVTADLEETGTFDISSQFSDITKLRGMLHPGQEKRGTIVFDVEEAEHYFISVRSGFLSSGAVKNQTVWNIQNENLK
ncbi:DUF4352 domain-containing protein [Alkalihalobacterium alkalicellulosilyticum]|uniref:DUF4352 domain-containing protein n=1 Tax=Alkalihalobacterium alkalicellulosilyticum TaxID=1912214 RepID=UPI00099859DF|nr:DUF4352 domain-containing protein [Bacillus alkalicellulosilyticus]